MRNCSRIISQTEGEDNFSLEYYAEHSAQFAIDYRSESAFAMRAFLSVIITTQTPSDHACGTNYGFCCIK